MTDEHYMKMALKLARRGEGWTSPNPMVGAVIVKDGKVIGRGYHRRYGEAHAEVNAINDMSGSVEGATFYVTLEPCSHHGKTPPCVDRIIEAKASRVVMGSVDPNPLVSGRGISILNGNGIETKVGVLGEQCEDLNEKFFKLMKTGIPFVTLKYAQTLDGRIASATGHSQWISSEPSLRFAHRLRGLHDAVLVGIGTVIADDPDLRVRLVRGRNPLRVVADSTLRIPPGVRVLDNQDVAKTLIATGPLQRRERLPMLEEKDIETLIIDKKSNGVLDLKKLLAELGKRQISSLLVEGGAGIITSFVRDGLFDRVIVITAPRILGRGIEAVGDLGISRMDDSIALKFESICRKGDDIVTYLRKKD
ncbi:MAG: bifunctional diaminohydroxyphosphoribosylaminopyrimidine deaminase/5-amino-6-(5-phosphoribosylamino)uracil reductase RibD [Thermodesulfobacteriota bacterium]|nr:bifunctional diaminohydroxyphosphoribosylaminopyrimidine deaminase/5-amino-6-(5-phosphoribosylamino)uracil reductase RibD [Thermodesulfobacteriota bacterium]